MGKFGFFIFFLSRDSWATLFFLVFLVSWAICFLVFVGQTELIEMNALHGLGFSRSYLFGDEKTIPQLTFAVHP